MKMEHLGNLNSIAFNLNLFGTIIVKICNEKSNLNLKFLNVLIANIVFVC